MTRRYSIGVVNWILPPHIVPSQLNVLTALGKRDHHRRHHERHAQGTGFMPDTNMWCPHTMKPSPAIAEIE